MNRDSARKSDVQLYLRLLGHVVPYSRVFLLSLFGMIVLAATAPLVAALLKPALDDAFIARDPDMIRRLPAYIVILFIVRAAASYVSVVSLHWVANKVVMDLRSVMFRRLLELPSRYYDHHNTGATISRFTYDVTQIRQASTESITVLFRDSLYVAGLFAWMLYINWQLTLISAISAPFIAGVVNRLRHRLRTMNRKVQDSMADIHQALGEVIGGQRIVKLFGAQEQEAGRFHGIINASRRFSMKAAAAAAATSPAVELITALALALIIYVAGRQALAMLYRSTTDQAQVMAYADDFWLISMVFIALLPLIPLMRRVRTEQNEQARESAGRVEALPAPTND